MTKLVTDSLTGYWLNLVVARLAERQGKLKDLKVGYGDISHYVAENTSYPRQYFNCLERDSDCDTVMAGEGNIKLVHRSVGQPYEAYLDKSEGSLPSFGDTPQEALMRAYVRKYCGVCLDLDDYGEVVLP